MWKEVRRRGEDQGAYRDFGVSSLGLGLDDFNVSSEKSKLRQQYMYLDWWGAVLFKEYR